MRQLIQKCIEIKYKNLHCDEQCNWQSAIDMKLAKLKIACGLINYLYNADFFVHMLERRNLECT